MQRIAKYIAVCLLCIYSITLFPRDWVHHCHKNKNYQTTTGSSYSEKCNLCDFNFDLGKLEIGFHISYSISKFAQHAIFYEKAKIGLKISLNPNKSPPTIPV